MAYKKIILRRDTATNWSSANPTLSGGEVGIETDTLKMKLGNGSTAWNSLGYYAPPTLDEVGDVTITSASSGQFLKWNGSAWVNDTIDLGTDTAGGYVASLVAGTGVTLSNNSGETATPTIAIGQAVGTTSNVTFNDVTVSGNLTVSGTTTTLNTETMTINDNIIVLNNNATGAPSENAGIEIERGSANNVQIRWNETTDVWEATVNGTVYSPLITELTLEQRFGQEHWHKPVDLSTNAVLPQTPTYSAGTTDADGGTGIGATLTGTSNARLVIDGVNASTGTRVLVKNQVVSTQNGIYVVTAQGSASAVYVLTRATDMNGVTAGQITQNETVGASNGDVNHLQTFAISSAGSGTNGAHVIGTDNITFQQTTGIGYQFDAGAGLTSTNNTLNVATASSSRIVANADSIDLAEVARTNSGGSATSTFMTSVTTDAYGRVTASTSAEASIALGSQTTGDYVGSITGGTGVTSSAATTGEGTTHTLSIGQSVGTGDNVSFASLYLTGGITMEGTTSDEFELVLNAGDPTADRTITFPNATGTVALTSNLTPYATLASPTFTGTVTLPANTISQSMMNDDSVGTNEIVGLAVTTGKIEDGAVTSAKIADGTIVNGDINASAGIVDTKLATISTAGKVSNSATTATDANTASAIVARDASGNFTAGTITAALTGNASTATTLATARTIAGQSFNGSANISIAPTNLTGVTATAAEINILASTLVSAAELNYVDGVTSAIQTQLDAKAPLNSPALTGTPTAPTATAATNTTQVATTAFVRAEIASLVGSAGSTLDTLGEIATALGNDANLSATLTTSIGLKAPTASPTFTGTVTIPTGASITLPTVASGANYAGSSSGSTKLQASATASGTITLPAVTGTVITSGDTGTVTSTMILDGTIVNADVNASAAIALSKLASGTSGQFVVANSSGVPTYVTPSGDVTWTDAGVVSIGSGKVTSAMILDGTIVNADISASAAIDRGKIADVSTSAQTASYTLVLADKNKVVEMSVATANTLTVPPNSSVAFPVGTQINVLQTGAGQCTITPGAAVTVNGTPGLKVRTQWSYVTLIKRATDTWVVVGDLSA
jgi:hypothetical protein